MFKNQEPSLHRKRGRATNQSGQVEKGTVR